MSGHGAKFGRKKEAAIAALLTQRTAEDAARSIGIGPATLRRWQKDPEFQAALREAMKDAYRQTIGRMHHLSSAAVSMLGKVMMDPGTPPATKVRAADSLLNHTAKAIEIEDIDARLKELEQAAENNKGGTRR
jgi:hypothetical protein